MNYLEYKVRKYHAEREQRKEFWGSLAVVILLAVFAYMFFSFL